MPYTPLDDFSALDTYKVPKIVESPTQQLVLDQLVEGETLWWYQPECVRPELGEQGITPSFVVSLLLFLITAYVAFFQVGSHTEWFILLGPLGVGALFWTILSMPVPKRWSKRRQAREAERHYYGLSSHALYVVQQDHATRYALPHLYEVEAVPPPSLDEADRPKGQLKLVYQDPTQRQRQRLRLEGIPDPEALAAYLKKR